MNPLARSFIDHRIDAKLYPEEIAGELVLAYSDTSFDEFVKYLASRNMLKLDTNNSSFRNCAFNFYQNLPLKPKRDHNTDAYTLNGDNLFIDALSGQVSNFIDLLKIDKHTTKFRILYLSWEHVVKSQGFQNIDDIKILNHIAKIKRFQTSTTISSFIDLGILVDAFKTRYESTLDKQMFEHLDSYSVNLFTNKPWACTSLVECFDRLDNASIHAVLTGNRTGLPYPENFLRKCFYHSLASNFEWTFGSMSQWLPVCRASRFGESEITKTPLTLDMLAAALIAERTGLITNTQHIKNLGSVFPGFTRKIDRAKIAKEFFPKLDTALNLQDLYSFVELVRLVAESSKEDTVTYERLPELVME